MADTNPISLKSPNINFLEKKNESSNYIGLISSPLEKFQHLVKAESIILIR